MSDMIWTLETLKSIEQLDYLWKVMDNLDVHAVVHFGTKGGGYSPNYLIARIDGEKTAYRGLSHEVDDSHDDYNPSNLSEHGFSLAELMWVYDQQSKSAKPAIKLMSEYWKENKSLFSPSKPIAEYREKIIALSTAGTPIDKAFKLTVV
ncbi:hypothetical protein [Shewanella kaireitica]|uniref:hypothetical protein n=1 Tax=Shewanella kaireitica TaxID=212021 RepID=UPI00200BEF2B|nr:hypothetical protein [Shewanella kaireitica]MCL1095855.1 hypothetical protein [Shewanella kaireitica]